MRRTRGGRRGFATSVLTIGVVLAPGMDDAVAGPTPQPLAVAVSGANGVNRIHEPGRRCAEGGSGQYRHASVEAPLPTAPNAVISSSLPGVLRGTFNVHHDGDEPVGTPLTGAAATAFLQGTESHATLSNQRGSVQVRFTGGSCAAPALAFDGTTVTGSGSWTIDPASTTGSYHPSASAVASGSGTYTLALGVAPGADNPWSLSLNGNITVPQPSLRVEAIDSSWGSLGVDYATRRVTVTYRITNVGPGDSFNPVLTSTTSPTHGVTPLGPQPQKLPDLPHGTSTVVSVRYQLGLLAPCALVILGCQFDTKVSVSLPDVLDKATTPPPTVTMRVRAPDFPPPL